MARFRKEKRTHIGGAGTEKKWMGQYWHKKCLRLTKKGAKKIRKDGSIIAEFRWFKVIYREFKVKDIRKIYPITVMD